MVRKVFHLSRAGTILVSKRGKIKVLKQEVLLEQQALYTTEWTETIIHLTAPTTGIKILPPTGFRVRSKCLRGQDLQNQVKKDQACLTMRRKVHRTSVLGHRTNKKRTMGKS